jgi:hypothetical protein
MGKDVIDRVRPGNEFFAQEGDDEAVKVYVPFQNDFLFLESCFGY